MTDLVPIDQIQNCILLIREEKIIIDADLAELYGVETKVFNQAVKRNIERFPKDFMFQLSKAEKDEVVTNCDHLSRLKYSPVLPYAFTEHGAIMAAMLLNSPKAVEVSVYVVRTFARLRQYAMEHKEFAKHLDTLEKKVQTQDVAIKSIILTLRNMLNKPVPPKRPIGFHAELDADRKAKK